MVLDLRLSRRIQCRSAVLAETDSDGNMSVLDTKTESKDPVSERGSETWTEAVVHNV